LRLVRIEEPASPTVGTEGETISGPHEADIAFLYPGEKSRPPYLFATHTASRRLASTRRQPIYEQSAAQTVRGQQSKRFCGWSRQPGAAITGKWRGCSPLRRCSQALTTKIEIATAASMAASARKILELVAMTCCASSRRVIRENHLRIGDAAGAQFRSLGHGGLRGRGKLGIDAVHQCDALT
jgi:hypothetical protein